MSLPKLSRKAFTTAAGVATLAACTPGSLGSSSDGGSEDGVITLTLLVDNSEQTVKSTASLVEPFHKAQSEVRIKVESRPQGADGDNLIKTRFATGEITDLVQYNSGSLLSAIDPATNLAPITGDTYVNNLQESFVESVTVDSEVYGVPFGQAMAGGILYNKKIYADLGLEIPKTWDEFMGNNDKIKAAGIDPVLQSYGETWTSQLFVLADFHNVMAQQPDWADKYTANQAKYADQPALRSFERLEAVHQAGYMNKDFASLQLPQALQALVEGRGAHFPMLTMIIPSYVGLSQDAAENIGFFAQPGDDASKYGLTVWSPAMIGISAKVTGEKLEAAKKFFAHVASVEACTAASELHTPTGPYMVKGATLPDGLPTAVQDFQAYFDEGNTTLALEFLSPIKGPNLEKLCVEVGSGITTAVDGAARYDEDVKKQAQQLGLPGW